MRLTDQEFEAQYWRLLAEVARFHEALAAAYKTLSDGDCVERQIQVVAERLEALAEAAEAIKGSLPLPWETRKMAIYNSAYELSEVSIRARSALGYAAALAGAN